MAGSAFVLFALFLALFRFVVFCRDTCRSLLLRNPTLFRSFWSQPHCLCFCPDRFLDRVGQIRYRDGLFLFFVFLHGKGDGMRETRSVPAHPAKRPAVSHPTFAEAFRFWLKLGFISFGGPTGQIAIMQTELVEKKRWISQARFLHALNYCMLLPGPEAQQLATYIGWLLHETWGGIVAGALFVIPSIFILWGLVSFTPPTEMCLGSPRSFTG